MPNIEFIDEMIRIPIAWNGGLDEAGPVTDIEPGDFIELIDWRLSKDGKRHEKRYGIDSIKTDFAEDLFGLGTYYDANDAFCYLAIRESGISRKVGAAAWASIHTFSGNIAHPVKPLEIQGKQFIINEVDSRMVHTDGNDYQIGITAPTVLPTLTGGYVSLLLDEDMAVITDWTLMTANGGACTQVTYDSKSCVKYDNTSGAGAACGIYRTLPAGSVPGSQFGIELDLYIDEVSTGGTNYMECYFRNGTLEVKIRIDSNGMYVYDGIDYNAVGVGTKKDIWQNLKFYAALDEVKSAYVKIYRDNEYLGQFSCVNRETSSEGLIHFDLYGQNSVAYIDFIKVSNLESGKLNGQYRYAVTHSRSGNFGCESNPIKSKVESELFTGSGLDDMTSSGDYSGSVHRRVRVKIDGTGTPDTVTISYDNGVTWEESGRPISTTMYLSHGVVIDFVATTGHTLNDYWFFDCDALSVFTVNQKVTISSIPNSADPQVDQRKIYRTVAGGAVFYWLATINDNTTTTYVDNHPDTALGAIPLTDDKDILPNGKFSAWWDNRLWVSGDNIVYYSDTEIPEQFDLLNRYVIIRKGDMNDKLTGMAVYMDGLYVFKRNSAFLIYKTALGYGRKQILDSVGCKAPWSIVEVNNLLMWISDRGMELFNGSIVYPDDFGVKAHPTLNAIEDDKLDYITAVHNRRWNEACWSLPDRGAESSLTLVYNTLKGKFYHFSQSKEISTLNFFEDSGGRSNIAVGTRDGYFGQADPSTAVYRDWAAGTITSTGRKGQIDLGATYDIHMIEVEFESVVTKDLTFNIYTNVDKDVVRTATLSGDTPSATDQKFRRPVLVKAECGFQARYFNMELINSDVIAGDCKINKVAIWANPVEAEDSFGPD